MRKFLILSICVNIVLIAIFVKIYFDRTELIIYCPNCLTKILNLISSTKNSVYVQSLVLENNEIEKLIEKLKDGKIVKIILNSKIKENEKLANKSYVKLYSENYLSSNIIIIDNDYLIISTQPFNKYFDKNFAMIIVLKDYLLINKVKKDFEKAWNSI